MICGSYESVLYMPTLCKICLTDVQYSIIQPFFEYHSTVIFQASSCLRCIEFLHFELFNLIVC